MSVAERLEELQKRARKDEKIRKILLETRNERDPLEAFCRACRELGVPIYEMELVEAGEEFYAEIRRSTNGGGENSPLLAGEDDFYELFFAGL
ncbi:hypothetical protein MUB23_01920 [Cuneatibacter sp. NSJ-177]|uniref:hypothetical protein n=1 Tax=Cuneatibacter sp. NSJ-177 TaxID=2931401 RepID=UPI001FD5C327|nr:hypothetical protein [Cuneatibacter sp. NSJ-177]MCJ7834154.1 hypothetical protein [Cuneatibacter sp. NSJ-177]